MQNVRLDGQVAIVTGAGRGLGRAHALRLAAHGASVIVNDPGVSLDGTGGDEGPAADVVAEIRSKGGQAEANFGNVANVADARAMIDMAISSFGSIDILVNNAGNFIGRTEFENASDDDFASIWSVHVTGTLNTIRAAWQPMRQRGFGRIINTTSHTALLGSKHNVAYSSAKGAIFGLTKSLSLESRDHGISINAIAPGALTRPVARIDAATVQIPEGAFDPSLASPIVVWLAHKDCPANGEVFGTMSGSTTRLLIAESEGYFSPVPTAEGVRDHFAEIMADEAIAQSGLVFEKGAEQRGMELMQRFVGASAQ